MPRRRRLEAAEAKETRQHHSSQHGKPPLALGKLRVRLSDSRSWGPHQVAAVLVTCRLIGQSGAHCQKRLPGNTLAKTHQLADWCGESYAFGGLKLGQLNCRVL